MSAAYRSAEMQRDAIAWIEDDAEVAAILGADGDVIPVAIARETEADPRVSVGARTQTADRVNDRDDSTFEIRVIVDGSQGFVEANGTQELTRLKDRVSDVLTEHRPGFYDPTVQDDEEIQPNENLNRHMGVVSVTLSRRDAR